MNLMQLYADESTIGNLVMPAVTGIIPYNELGYISDINAYYTFLPGCFDVQQNDAVPILLNHNPFCRIDQSVTLEDDRELGGLVLTAWLREGFLARDLLLAMRYGAFGFLSPGMSITHRTLEKYRGTDHVIVETTKLREISFTDNPAWIGAVASIRQQQSEPVIGWGERKVHSDAHAIRLQNFFNMLRAKPLSREEIDARWTAEVKRGKSRRGV